MLDFLFVLAPRPPNADFRLLSSKELSEAEKETSAKPVCRVISLNIFSLLQRYNIYLRYIIHLTRDVSLTGNNHNYCLK